MDEERVRQGLSRIQSETEMLRSQYGDVSNLPSTLNVGQKSSSIYLSTQLVDLLLLVNVETPEELEKYVEDCAQLVGYELEEVNIDNLEDKKKDVFRAYVDSFIPFQQLAARPGFDETASFKARAAYNIEKNVPQRYKDGATAALEKGESSLINYLSGIPGGDKYIENIGRFISVDYENIHGVTYEEIVALDQLIKRDSTIKGIVCIGAKYDMTMHYDKSGIKKFDTYFLDRAMAYCKKSQKHMRFHSLFDRTTAMDFHKKGYSKEQVMSLLAPYADGFFDYLQNHNERLDDGSRIIDSAEIFNELLPYKDGEPSPSMGDGLESCWEKYFGMSMDDLFIFIFDDGKSRVPEDVDVMYNETALEEDPERLKAAERMLQEIERVCPGFINTFGNQMHIYDHLFRPENIHNLEASIEFMRRVQDELGIKVQITEHDLNLNGDLVRDCRKYDAPEEYLRLLKAYYQAILSDYISRGGLDIESVDYWSVFDKVDHNLRREIEARIKNGQDYTYIDSLHAGLLPASADVSKIETLNPQGLSRQKEKEEARIKKLEYPTNPEGGSASIIIVLVCILLALIAMIVVCFMVM